MKWMSPLIALSAMTFSAVAAPLSLNEAWDNNSDPEIMSYFFTRQMSRLPLSGELHATTKYWSGDYWALKRGNINYRWYARRKVGFNLNSPNKERARRMTLPELAELAPSEKYDLYVGRYDYPLRNEVDRIAADAEAEIWEGICHGWSPATMNHEEPTPKVMKNPDGIEIPFGSTDIKALISYYYAYGPQASNTYQMGRRCYKGPFLNRDKDCREDMNAGAFHIVLANRLGIDGIGFIADVERYKEVWNHPITKYSSSIEGSSEPGGDSAKGTVKVLRVKTTITYLDENGYDWQVVYGTDKQSYKTLNYEYDLDIDAFDNIIGGEWISRIRPDFLWMRPKVTEFKGNLSRLNDLLND